jgi:hypothetical protein
MYRSRRGKYHDYCHIVGCDTQQFSADFKLKLPILLDLTARTPLLEKFLRSIPLSQQTANASRRELCCNAGNFPGGLREPGLHRRRELPRPERQVAGIET